VLVVAFSSTNHFPYNWHAGLRRFTPVSKWKIYHQVLNLDIQHKHT
jgi:hypothetical protein